jgi:hypothetical protein
VPTIAEPYRPPPSHPPLLPLNLHLVAILADFAERRLTPSPLGILSHALEVGHSEAMAVALARMIEEDRRAA